MTVSQSEQKKRIPQTTVHATAEHLEETTGEQLPVEVGSWSQEAHEPVQASSQQHLREGIEFSSRESASAASATLAQEVTNIFQTRIQPVTEETIPGSEKRADRVRASVSSTEATQHLARVHPVAETTQDVADVDAAERGRASLSRESIDRAQTTTVQTDEALKRRPRDATPTQRATLAREPGDIEIIGSTQTLAESLVSRKPEAAAGRSKAAVKREVKTKTSVTAVQPVAEAAEEYDKASGTAERAVLVQGEPERVAATKVQPIAETVQTGIEEVKRKTSRANISRTPQDLRPTETIQVTAEAVTDQEQFKPQPARARVTQDSFEVSQTQTAQTLTAPSAYGTSDLPQPTDKAKIVQEEPEPIPQTIIQATGEFAEDTEDFKPVTDKATLILETPMTGHSKSVEIIGEKVASRKETAAEVGKAEVKQQVLKTTKRTTQTINESLTEESEEFRPETEKATVTLEVSLPEHEKSIEVPGEKISARKEAVAEMGKAEAKRQKLRSAKATVQTASESAPESEQFKPDTERATVSLEAPIPDHVKMEEVAEEKAEPRRESVSEVGKAEVKQEKLKTRKTIVQTTEEFVSEDKTEFKPETETASVTLEKPLPGQIKSVEVPSEKTVERKEAKVEVGKAKLRQGKKETTETTTLAIGESIAGVEGFVPETDKATVAVEAPMPGHEKSIEVVGEKVVQRKVSAGEVGKAEVKQQKLKTTKTTVQTTGEFVGDETKEFKPESDKALVSLEKPRPGSVKSVEVIGEGLVVREESADESAKAEVKQDRFEPTKQSTVDVVTSGVSFKSEDSKLKTRKAVVRQTEVSEQLPSTTTLVTGESLLDEEATSIPGERASLRPESPEAGLIQTASTVEEQVSEAPKPKPRKEKAKKVLGSEQLEAAHAKTVQTATGEEVLEKAETTTDVATPSKILAQTAAATTIQTLEGTAKYTKEVLPTTKATRVQEEAAESWQESTQPIAEAAKPGVRQSPGEKERAAVTREPIDATTRTVQPVGEQVAVEAKKAAAKDRATARREVSGEAHVTKVQQVDETVSYEGYPELPDQDRASLVQTAPEATSAETTQLVTGEVAETRKESVPEKAKAKPKQEKLKAVTKTETQATSQAKKQAQAEETAAATKARMVVEESERVLPTKGVEDLTELASREDFEEPETVVAVQTEVADDVTEKSTVAKEAKVVEVKTIVSSNKCGSILILKDKEVQKINILLKAFNSLQDFHRKCVIANIIFHYNSLLGSYFSSKQVQVQFCHTFRVNKRKVRKRDEA